jgi:hypothetical protein
MSIAFFNFSRYSMGCGVCPVCRKTLRGRGLLMRVLEVIEVEFGESSHVF